MRKVRTRKKKLYNKIGSFIKRSLLGLFYFTKIPAVYSSILIIGFLMWFNISGSYDSSAKYVYNLVYNASVKTGLVFNDILLEGQERTEKTSLIDIVSHNENKDEIIHKGYPLLFINLKQIQQNIEQLPWVKLANVERRFPSTLAISILERIPMALWQEQGKVHLIDSDGEIINEPNLKEYSDLIIIVGKDIPLHARSLLKMIQSEPELIRHVSSAIRISQRRWNIRLNNGTEIRLPENHPQKAWSELASYHMRSNLLESNPEYVDLKVAGKMFVK